MTDDQALLQMLKSEPEKGLAEFVERFAGLIYSIVAGRAGSAAEEEDIEECVSDIVFEIFQKIETIDLQKGSLRAWTSAVARNRAINLYRKKMREQDRTAPQESLDFLTDQSDTEQEVLDRDERKRLLDAVKSLGEPDSTIIFRKYYFGQKSKEIAEDLDMSIGAVDTRLSRAISKLRVIIGGKESWNRL